MTENADIRLAADRLQSALHSLEATLTPLLKEVDRLKAVAQEAESFKADRTSLAKQLDDAKAREDEFSAREAEFSNLAEETMSELDRVIRQVKDVLGHEGG